MTRELLREQNDERRNANHNGDAKKADEHLGENAIGNLGKDEVASEGQKDPHAERFE